MLAAMALTRRALLTGFGAAAAASAWRRAASAAASLKLSVLTDEISQDFGHACEVASREFGLGLVDLREAGGKNIMNWDAARIADTRKVLERFKLRVACIASPIFKVDWPDAPKSSFSPKRDEFGASFTYAQQTELLERAFELAKTFDTDRIRIFDFWRLDDQAPHRKAIDDVIRAAAVKALQLTWDPGNAQFRDEVPFPGGYAAMPKDRIGHVHCKDAARGAGGKWEWMAMGRGVIDWAGQFRALQRDGYRHACTLETHWRGGGTPEESSRQSFAGMKTLLEKATT